MIDDKNRGSLLPFKRVVKVEDVSKIRMYSINITDDVTVSNIDRFLGDWHNAEAVYYVDPKYPADDVTYTVTVGGGYRGYSISAFVDGFQRLSGVSYSENNTVDPKERFTALKASQTKVGLSNAISLSSEWSMSGYIAHSVMAKNNPTDEWIGGIGVSYYQAP